MDPLVTDFIAVPLLKSLLKIVTQIAAQKAGKTLLTQMETQKRMAFIDSICGDQLPECMIRLHEDLEDAVQEIKAELQYQILRQSSQSEYRNILEKLHGIGAKCSAYMKYPKSLSAQSEFIAVCTNNCPSNILSWLYFRLTSPTHMTGDFLNDVSKVCNYTQFVQWSDHLSSMAGLASFYRVTLLNLKLWRAKQTGFSTDEDNESITNELKNMEIWLNGITATLTAKCYEKRSEFLQPCDDQNHKNCGGKQQECCTVLGKIVYTFLREFQNRPMTENQAIACKLAERLKHDYPWYKWAVLVNKFGSINEDLVSNRDFDHSKSDELRVQYLGVEQLLAKLLPDSFQRAGILSKGTAYGELTCYFIPSHQLLAEGRVAHVFWAEKQQVQLVSQLPVDLLTSLHGTIATELFAKHKDDKEKFANLKKLMMFHGYDYVFVQAVTMKEEDKLGMRLIKRSDRTWPLYVEHAKGHLFIWPCKITHSNGGCKYFSQSSSHPKTWFCSLVFPSAVANQKKKDSIIVAGRLHELLLAAAQKYVGVTHRDTALMGNF